MAITSHVSVSKELTNTGWAVTAAVVPGGVLPLDIFLYTNTGQLTLGDYSGVVGFDRIQNTQIFDEHVTYPTFGNKFLRHNQAKINVDFDTDVNLVITQLIASIQSLSSAYQAGANSTTVYDIQ